MWQDSSHKGVVANIPLRQFGTDVVQYPFCAMTNRSTLLFQSIEMSTWVLSHPNPHLLETLNTKRQQDLLTKVQQIEIKSLLPTLLQSRYTPAANFTPLTRYEKHIVQRKGNNGCHSEPAGIAEKQQAQKKQWTHHHIERERERSHAGHWWWPMLPFVFLNLVVRHYHTLSI